MLSPLNPEYKSHSVSVKLKSSSSSCLGFNYGVYSLGTMGKRGQGNTRSDPGLLRATVQAVSWRLQAWPEGPGLPGFTGDWCGWSLQGPFSGCSWVSAGGCGSTGWSVRALGRLARQGWPEPTRIFSRCSQVWTGGSGLFFFEKTQKAFAFHFIGKGRRF
jgi:hypothetical protein